MMLLRRPAAFEGQDLAMFNIPASDMSNADEQKLDSSSQHTGSSSGTESCCSKFLYCFVSNVYNCSLQSSHVTVETINVAYVGHIWQILVPTQAYKKTRVNQQTRYAFSPHFGASITFGSSIICASDIVRLYRACPQMWFVSREIRVRQYWCVLSCCAIRYRPILTFHSFNATCSQLFYTRFGLWLWKYFPRQILWYCFTFAGVHSFTDTKV